MKIKKIALIVFTLIYLLGCTNKNIIELPMTEKIGYGPFTSSLGGISAYSEDENNPWKKTYINASHIPDNWIDAKQGDIEINIYQSVYQNYHLGNITEELYKSLQTSWNWIPDTLNLSKKPLKCKIAFAFGKDSVGDLKMIVDKNNNLDFSDDKIFKPIEFTHNKKANNDSLALSNSIEVTYERFINNKIVTVKASLFITHMNQYKMSMSNFPQYAITQLNGEEIAICSNNFTNLSYNSATIAVVNDNIETRNKALDENIASMNEYLEIKGEVYKNLGVNLNKNILTLEKISLPKNQLHSTQVGFKSFPLKGNDFITNSLISLDSLKGKFVLLDFWAVWCGPCIKEMPNLKELYSKVDKSKFEIVGIVGDSPSAALKKIIDKQSIDWPQILSDDTNKIKETYGIKGYPTSFLLNPKGIIVAKNLRGKELVEKIISLINEQ
jgi:thiol-disulfide isomerase/thioredoxin